MAARSSLGGGERQHETADADGGRRQTKAATLTDEWFRRPDWDGAARADFERRLARAHPRSRPQYLRVKALALRDAGDDEGARTLLLRVLDPDGAHPGEVAIATELLGDLAVRQGDGELAERYYRRGLDAPGYPSGTTGAVEISLAELLLNKGNAGRDEALTLLDSWLARSGLRFDNQMFRWHLAVIKAAEQTGDRETVRRAANTALELASRGPQLARHEDVGLVQADAAALSRLRNLAR